MCTLQVVSKLKVACAKKIIFQGSLVKWFVVSTNVHISANFKNQIKFRICYCLTGVCNVWLKLSSEMFKVLLE